MMRMKKFPPIAICCAVLFLISCAPTRQWNEFRGRQGMGKASSGISPPIAVKWKFLLQLPEADRRYFNQPLLVDRTIYFGSSDGNFYSLNLDTGYMNWVFRTEGPINSVAYADKNRVYFGSGDRYVYALNRTSGQEDWRFETRGSVSTTMVPYKDFILASSDRDAVYFLNKQGKAEFSLDNPVWNRNAFIVRDHLMAFAPGPEESNHRLGVYDLEDRKFLWTFHTEEEDLSWFSFPVIYKRRLYFFAGGVDQAGNMLFRYSCHNARTGTPVWVVQEVSPAGSLPPGASSDQLFYDSVMLLDYGAPLIWRNRVIYASGDHLLRCFHAGTGEKIWQREYDRPIADAPVLAGNRIYFGLRQQADLPGRFLCASAADGRILWDMEVEGSILNSPVVAGRWILFGTDQGSFYVLESVF